MPSNYRPVSLTSVIRKMLKHAIKNRLLQYFMRNKFITSRQHGFRPGHSCETQLIHVLDDWTSALGLGHQVEVYIIYLDLQKAFDKAPHARWLSKLESYGIGGKLYYYNALKIFHQIEGSVCICMDPNQIGQIYLVKYLNEAFWVHFCLLFMLIICQM